MTEFEIEAFLMVIKKGNISLASESLHITQPALSRRISALEEELGYKLINRKKGIRNIELTNEGKSFIPIAKKWISVCVEAKGLSSIDYESVLNIASIGSISTYIIPEVFINFMECCPDKRLSFHNYHSHESYEYVEKGLIDIAIISDDMYSKNVKTIPLFSEPMVFICGKMSHYEGDIDPKQINIKNEIRLPWNPEFDLWHEYWFGNIPEYKIFLDQMSLLEEFLAVKDVWAIVPMSVAQKISQNSKIKILNITEPPEDRIIYYLKSNEKKNGLIDKFLDVLNEEINKIDNVKSYLYK